MPNAYLGKGAAVYCQDGNPTTDPDGGLVDLTPHAGLITLAQSVAFQAVYPYGESARRVFATRNDNAYTIGGLRYSNDAERILAIQAAAIARGSPPRNH